MALPAFIGFAVFFLAPAAMSLLYSFTDWNMYKQEISFIGLDNFKKLFNDAKIIAVIEQTIRYALLMTVIQNALAILLAVALHRKLFMAGLLKTLLFLPAVLSIMVVGYLFKYIMTSADSGLLNSIIVFFGGKPLNWLGNEKLALYSVLITQVWQWTGWAMVIYIANLKSIDPVLYEAVKIDGATPGQVFRRITLPLLYPAVSFNVLMSLIGGLKMFDAVWAMTSGGPGIASDTIMTTIIRTGTNRGRYAYVCAFGVIFLLIVFLISRLLTFIFHKWEAKVT